MRGVPALFLGFSRKVWGANKGLGEATKSCTRKEYESATNSIAKRGQGAIAPCRVKGQRPLWGLGQRPNCSSSDQSQGSRQQRCRQRSVPASNFARPQTRPQAALPQDSVKSLFLAHFPTQNLPNTSSSSFSSTSSPVISASAICACCKSTPAKSTE